MAATVRLKRRNGVRLAAVVALDLASPLVFFALMTVNAEGLDLGFPRFGKAISWAGSVGVGLLFLEAVLFGVKQEIASKQHSAAKAAVYFWAPLIVQLGLLIAPPLLLSNDGKLGPVEMFEVVCGTTLVASQLLCAVVQLAAKARQPYPGQAFQVVGLIWFVQSVLFQLSTGSLALQLAKPTIPVLCVQTAFVLVVSAPPCLLALKHQTRQSVQLAYASSIVLLDCLVGLVIFADLDVDLRPISILCAVLWPILGAALLACSLTVCRDHMRVGWLFRPSWKET